MSLALNHELTQPKDIEVKTWGGRPPVVYLSTGTAHYTIALEDFLEAAWYVLTNANLDPNDPRLAFIERVRKLRKIPGWSLDVRSRRARGPKRLAVPPPRAARARAAAP